MRDKGTRVEQLIEQLRRISPMQPEGEVSTETLETCYAILEELQSLNDPRCIPAVLGVFAPDTSFGLAWEATHLLTQFPLEQVEPHLREALRTGQAGTRMWATHVLRHSGNPEVLPDLLALVRDPHPRVRGEVASALGFIGDPSLRPVLETMTRDPDSDVRLAARYALEGLEPDC